MSRKKRREDTPQDRSPPSPKAPRARLHPPRPRPAFLITISTILAGWIVFLLVLAFSSG